MAAQGQRRELPLLEVLDAARDSGIPAGRVQVAGLELHRRQLLASGDRLELDAVVNGQPRNNQLAETIFTAIDQGLARREGTAYHLTSAGRALLERHGVHASDEARQVLRQVLADSNGFR